MNRDIKEQKLGSKGKRLKTLQSQSFDCPRHHSRSREKILKPKKCVSFDGETSKLKKQKSRKVIYSTLHLFSDYFRSSDDSLSNSYKNLHLISPNKSKIGQFPEQFF